MRLNETFNHLNQSRKIVYSAKVITQHVEVGNFLELTQRYDTHHKSHTARCSVSPRRRGTCARKEGSFYWRPIATAQAMRRAGWYRTRLQGDVAFDVGISVSLLEVDLGDSTSARAA